jgi:hypothetical protein
VDAARSWAAAAEGMDAEEGRRVERTHAVVEVADDDDVAECG